MYLCILSIIVLFNLIYYMKFILRRICHAYFTYLSIIDLDLDFMSCLFY